MKVRHCARRIENKFKTCIMEYIKELWRRRRSATGEAGCQGHSSLGVELWKWMTEVAGDDDKEFNWPHFHLFRLHFRSVIIGKRFVNH